MTGSESNEFSVVSQVAGDSTSPIATIEVVGAFDASQTSRFDSAVAALPEGLTSMTVDLTGVSVLDSSALGAMVRLRQHLSSVGCPMTTIVDKPFQHTVLRATGLIDYLGVVDNSS